MSAFRSMNYLLMFALFGTALVASGAAALNQLLEAGIRQRGCVGPRAGRCLPGAATGDGDVVRGRLFAGGNAVSGAVGESADQRFRRDFIGELPVHLYPAESVDVVEHGGGRNSQACRR